MRGGTVAKVGVPVVSALGINAVPVTGLMNHLQGAVP